MKTRSFTAQNASEIPAAIASYTTPEFVPVLAFVFASSRSDIHKISKSLKGSGLLVMGSSSGGNILVKDNEQVIYEDAVVITLVEIDRNSFSYMVTAQEDLSDMDFGRKIGSWSTSQFSNAKIILVASGLGHNVQDMLEGILESAGEDTAVFGGMAGDDAKFKQNFVFSDREVLENGVIALAFDPEKIDIFGLSTSGWVGLGKDLNITAAESNTVYSIDNLPALDVYKKYLNVQEADLPALCIEYPLLVKRDDENFALRAVMGFDKERKSLIFAGTVPEDSIVTFSSSPGFEVIDRTCEEIKHFHKKHPKADLIILFSCIARHLALGPVINEEITYPAEKWNTTVTGFFTYGEIGTNDNSPCDFYNQTYSLVILKEKS